MLPEPASSPCQDRRRIEARSAPPWKKAGLPTAARRLLRAIRPIEAWSYAPPGRRRPPPQCRSEEHTSELQSLMRISYAVFCLKKQNNTKYKTHTTAITQIGHNT